MCLAAAWNVVAWLQIGLDWMFVNGLSLLFTQLALLGVLLVVLGFTSGVAPDTSNNPTDWSRIRLAACPRLGAAGPALADRSTFPSSKRLV